MIITLITWGIMLIIFSIYGIAINGFIKQLKVTIRTSGYDIIWFGIVYTTVYSQLFSIFYKVGKTAFCILAVIALILVFIFRYKYISVAEQISKKIIIPGGGYIIVGVCIVFIGLLFSTDTPSHYDTYLYHAQSIRWIEEYGVVKGLGNLHNRFAYNSAFMCLQGIFSFSWYMNRSLHTLNGFLWVFMSSYGIMTLKIFKNRRIFISDVLKIFLSIYLCTDTIINNLSSPHTDMMALIMVLYILVRWNELLEEGTQDYILYGILCLLGVCAVSIKLSTTMILVLVLKPAIILIRKKKRIAIFTYIGIGTFIILPF